jgi:predicted ATPase
VARYTIESSGIAKQDEAAETTKTILKIKEGNNMVINRIKIKDFLVFKGEFATDFCPGVNVFIGGNATGKTTLLKCLSIKGVSFFDAIKGNTDGNIIFSGTNRFGNEKSHVVITSEHYNVKNSVYIPEKDILEHAKGLLTFIEDKQTGFGTIYRDVLVKAQDIPTQKQSETQQKVGRMIVDTIGGDVHWDKGEGSYYTLRTDGTRIPFANEASGYKKLGFLGLLVTSGQLEKDSILFWDEPENSLNPELMPVLVEILLELQRSGVQVFIATHSYSLARWFDVKRDSKKGDDVMFYNLSKSDKGGIECTTAAEYTKLSESILDTADDKLFKAVVADAMEVQKDE